MIDREALEARLLATDAPLPWLREAIQAAGQRQADFAAAVGCSASHLSNVLAGKRVLSEALREQIIAALALSPVAAEQLRGLLCLRGEADEQTLLRARVEARRLGALADEASPEQGLDALSRALAAPLRLRAEDPALRAELSGRALRALAEVGPEERQFNLLYQAVPLDLMPEIFAELREVADRVCFRAAAPRARRGEASRSYAFRAELRPLTRPLGAPITRSERASTEVIPFGSAEEETTDLFSTLDYRAFLRGWKRAHGRSVRWLQERVDLYLPEDQSLSRAWVGRVLTGDRDIALSHVEAWALALRLSPEEAEHLERLVAFRHARTGGERERWWREIQAILRHRGARRILDEAEALQRRWYLPAVRELAFLKGFSIDHTWVAEVMRPRIREEEAASALHLLCRLGYLARGADGRLRPAQGLSVVAEDETLERAAALEQWSAVLGLPGVEQAGWEGERCLLSVGRRALPALKREVAASAARLQGRCDAALSGQPARPAQGLPARPAAAPEVVVLVSWQLFPLEQGRAGEGG